MSVELVSSFICSSPNVLNVIGLACRRFHVHHCMCLGKIKLQMRPTKAVYEVWRGRMGTHWMGALAMETMIHVMGLSSDYSCAYLLAYM
jgi:hypothetical protein